MDRKPNRHLSLDLAAALIAGLMALLVAAPAMAAPPLPQPNPDRPAVTPVAGSGATASAGSGASISAGKACKAMRRQARSGTSRPALMVRNLRTGEVVCSLNRKASMSLASNTKIFTTVTALARLGPSHRFQTRVYAHGRIRNGVLRGDLYLRGGGDPTLGTSAFLDAYLGGAGSSIDALAARVRKAGIKEVTGRLYGDETVFDRLRGVADSGYATSPWIGPLSGLSFNAGYTSPSFSRFSSNPAKLATRTFARELRSRGIRVKAKIAMRKTPAGARSRGPVARLASPDMTWMARLTNLDSNNFFAEMLLKGLGAAVRRSGSTLSGTKVVRGYALNALGARVRPVDGSGLTISNRSSVGGVTRVLDRVRFKPYFKDFLGSLPLAGRDGTLADRMRGSAAEGRCRAKTGTLTGVSALSGYCYNRSGRRFAFSILMNGVYNVYSARAAQDRIAALIARI